MRVAVACLRGFGQQGEIAEEQTLERADLEGRDVHLESSLEGVSCEGIEVVLLSRKVVAVVLAVVETQEAKVEFVEGEVVVEAAEHYLQALL